MSVAADGSPRRIATNRRAFHDYTVLDRLEAGIELRGTEVKSVKNGHVSLAGSYARVENGQVILRDLNIPPYDHGNKFNHPAVRPRRLLLHGREIKRLHVQTAQKGCALVPLGVYVTRGLVKVDLGVCKGKRQYDKREALRRKDEQREMARLRARQTHRGGG